MIQRFRGHSPIIHPCRPAGRQCHPGGLRDGGGRLQHLVRGRAPGDESSIHVGAGSNIQDNAVLHCDADCPTVIGRDVTVGHGAILHSCTVEDTCLIGMGAILLNGCTIGAGSLVAAGALVTQGAVIPPGSLVVGSPARVVRSPPAGGGRRTAPVGQDLPHSVR